MKAGVARWCSSCTPCMKDPGLLLTEAFLCRGCMFFPILTTTPASFHSQRTCTLNSWVTLNFSMNVSVLGHSVRRTLPPPHDSRDRLQPARDPEWRISGNRKWKNKSYKTCKHASLLSRFFQRLRPRLKCFLLSAGDNKGIKDMQYTSFRTS